MPFSIVTNGTVIARNAGALYNFKAGYATMNWGLTQVGTGSADTLLNTVYNNSVGSASTTEVANTLVTNLGVTGTGVTALTAYFVGVLNAAPVTARGAAVNSLLTQFSSLATSTDAIAAPYKDAAIAWNTKVDAATAYAGLQLNADTTFIAATTAAATTYTLTTTAGESLTGSSGNDTFGAASTVNGGYALEGTLQSGDSLNGGAGTDTLNADMRSQISVTPYLTNIENVNIRAQGQSATDANSNNIGTAAGAGSAMIDAQRSAGVTKWASVDSRGDLIIEDVRILDNQVTKDITIEFKQGDPGNVDFGVYFNELSLRNAGTATSQLNLQVMDTVAAAAGLAPLLNSTYSSFTFTATIAGVSSVVTLSSQAIQDAQTYVQMVAAFQAAVDAQFGAGAVAVSLGANFTVNDPASGIAVTGQSVLLTAGGAVVITTPAGSGWSSTGVAPPASNFYTNFNSGGSSSTALVTSTIILDDVGMADLGGDLVVGAMSTGAHSTDRGVERFEITVNDNSRLQTITSTNDALREVTIVNGTTSSTSNAYITTVQDKGNLTVNGTATFNANAGFNGGGSAAADTPLPGVDTLHGGAGAAGFTDVRLIDGAAMTGKLAFTAAVTNNSIAKYVNLVDTAASPTADVAAATNVNHNVLGANFIYNGGANNDTMVVTIDPAVAASRSTIVSGQSDFTFAIDGGVGDDAITVNVNTGNTAKGNLDNWAANQDLNNNITITGGAGNDTIRIPGAGDTVINAGSGSDIVWTDNTGLQTIIATSGAVGITDGTTTSRATWVFNTWDQVNALANGAARNINDLRSDVNNSYNLYKSTLYVTFKGLQSATITLTNNQTTYRTTDLEINQAIKNAINNDATLKNLLSAQDGPGNTLVVRSAVDGAMVTTDLAVTLNAPATLTASEVTAINTAWSTFAAPIAYADSAAAVAAMGVTVAAFNTKGDYSNAMALATDSAGTALTGANSTATSDNFVTPGADNDLVVLGTTVGTIDVFRSSNEVVTYAAGFGNDVIVNFAATGNGIDHINFDAFMNSSSSTYTAPAVTVGALANTDNLIVITPEVTATNGTAALIKTLVDALGQPATATKQIYIAYSTVAASATDATNGVGKVYSVTNGTAVGDAVVTLEGTIDLADTGWAALTAANFTTPSSRAEGASGAPVATTQTAVIINQALVGTTGIDTLNTGGFTGVTMTGGAQGDFFVVTTGSTGSIITDLASGDVVTVAGTGVVVAGTVAAGVAAFVANAQTTNATAAANFTINSLAAGSTINMAAAGGPAGYTLVGGVGVDTLTGSAFSDAITTGGGADTVSAGAGNDTITLSAVAGAVAISTGTGADTVVVPGFAGTIANVSDLTSADVFTVAAGGALNGTNITNYTATAATVNNAGTTALVTLTTAAAGGTINMTAATGAWGFTINGGAGADTLTGSPLIDIITGGAGLDTINVGAAGTVDQVILTTVITAADRDVITNFVSAEDQVTIGSANTTLAGAAGAATVTADTTAAGAGGAAYAMTGATTANANVILLNTTGVLAAASANTGTLANATDGTELLKALTTAAAVDTYTGITAAAASQKAYLVASQGTASYVYFASDVNADSLIVASEIILVGTFSGTAALVAADFLRA